VGLCQSGLEGFSAALAPMSQHRHMHKGEWRMLQNTWRWCVAAAIRCVRARMEVLRCLGVIGVYDQYRGINRDVCRPCKHAAPV